MVYNGRPLLAILSLYLRLHIVIPEPTYMLWLWGLPVVFNTLMLLIFKVLRSDGNSTPVLTWSAFQECCNVVDWWRQFFFTPDERTDVTCAECIANQKSANQT